ncbi:hypothetical protein M2347_001227 [Chryseobacterium sp. H1D6B]|uniref:hypothetical protein n=1 Tax=Chryseobacterium sp. H1D6B TaxID=2940588 RepID=UPI002475B4A8|nr:hypothetical protein [Chryseobacterium sp. H1D6B]MDH6251500.1 hypothetical protein [Chryseobacterium sp. H1D6B]
MLTKFIIREITKGIFFALDELINRTIMKKEVGILLAGGVGLLAVLSFLSIKKVLSKKKKKYSDYYYDHHRHFDEKNQEDEYHGVEFYALK